MIKSFDKMLGHMKTKTVSIKKPLPFLIRMIRWHLFLNVHIIDCL